MRDVSGFDVQDALCRSDARFPIVIITAMDEPSLRARSLALGAAAFLPKPLDSAALLSTIATTVERDAIDRR